MLRRSFWLGFFFGTLALSGPLQAASRAPDAPPGQAVAKQHASLDLGDADGNGLADGLEGLLQDLGPGETIQVVVTLKRPAPKAEIEQAIGAFGLGHEFHLINGFSGTVTAGQARALAHLPFVFRVEPVYQVRPLMEGARTDMGVDDVPGSYVDSPGTGAGIGICFVDSGIEVDHEVFNDGGSSKIAGYCNAIGSTGRAETCAAGGVETVEDDVGHGTEVAGVAAGDGTGSPYAEALHGIAPAAPIYVAKALEAGPLGAVGDDLDVGAALEWCAGQPEVRVINLSIQGDDTQSDGLDAMSLVVNAAVQSGKVVVAGTGNSDLPHSVRPPATAHLALAVGAYGEWSDAPEFLAAANAIGPTEGAVAQEALSHGPFIAPFSSRGFTSDGRSKPDLVTPGHSIATASANLLPSILTCGNSCYDIVSGTSFSTPMLSGVVALILEANPDLTPDQVREILFTTARHRGYPDPTTGLPFKGTNYGYGIVDAYAAVAMARALGGDDSLSTVPTAMPSNFLTEEVLLTKEVDYNVDFTISAAEAASGVPLSVSMTGPLTGNLFCLLSCEYRPDIDIWLAKRAPNGSFQVQWSSLCPLGGGSGQVQCGPYGLQETITVPNPQAGDYRLIMRFLNVIGTPSNILYSHATYEISWGPMTTSLPAGVANQPPVALAAYSEDQGTVTLDGSASFDPDGSVIFYSWFWDGGSAVGAAPVLPFPNGTTPVTLTVVDNLDRTASTVIDVTVGAGGNQPPTVDAGPDDSIETNATFSSSGSFSDPDSASWSATVDYGDGGLDEALTLNPDKTFALSHVYTSAGVYTVTVTVDDGSDSGQDTAEVTVNDPPSNQPPVIDAGPDGSIETGATFTSSGSFNDPDSTIWSATVDYGDGGLDEALTLNPDKTFALSHVYASAGVYTVTVTVDDGSDSGQDTAEVTVSDPPSGNQPPIANAGPDDGAPLDRKGPNGTGHVTLDGSLSSDPDGDALSYTWTDANDAPVASGAQPTVDLPKGTHILTLTVDDGEFQDSDTVCIEIYNKNPSGACASLNPAPTAAFSVSTSGLTASFTDQSSDSDGIIVDRSWTFGDGGSSTGTNPTHDYAAAGSYDVTLTVTDDAGLMDSTTQTVTVSLAGGGLSLSASGYKVKGVQHVDLDWSGNVGHVDLWRDSTLVASDVAGSVYTDNIGAKGAGSYVYQVCESGTSTCSDTVTVTF